MEQERYLIVLASIVLLSFCRAAQLANLEKNYLYQAEENTLLDFWEQDMEYIGQFLLNATLTPYEHKESFLTRCQFHGFRLKSIKLYTENVQMTIDPDNYIIKFYQPAGFDWEIDLFWEFNLLYFPISGSATFSGQARDFLYQLNLTQPYEGKMFIPSVACKWKVLSSKIDSPVGSLFGIPDIVEKTFAEVMAGPLMSELNDTLEEIIPLKYEEYYSPKSDIITFSGLKDEQFEIMRRYKNVFCDKHTLAVGYKETIEHISGITKEETKPLTKKRSSLPVVGSGILRRYLREFTIFEQIASKIIPIVKDYLLIDKDLPKEQTMRLDPTTMQSMLPDFKTHYPTNVNISLVVNGKPSKVVVSSAGTQTLLFNNAQFEMKFYAKVDNKEECFLTTVTESTFGLNPISSWKDQVLVLNMEIQSVSSQVVSAESKIFETIMTKAVKEFTQTALREYLSGKCKTTMLGDGLKIRDEMITYGKVFSSQDISGQMLNIWIYQVA